jgi:hypothetical protein
MNSRFVGPLVLSLLGLLAPTADASSFRQFTLEELLAASPLIVRATATDVDPLGHEDSEGTPCTVVQLKVLETLKGNPGGTELSFCNSGGITAEGVVSMPIGLPAFTEGSTYLLFLQPKGWMFTPVVNWSAGMFREVRHENRAVYVSSSGESVVDLLAEGFDLGITVDESEQLRLLKRHGVMMEQMKLDSETGLVESEPARAARVALGLRLASATGAVLGKLRQALTEVAAPKSAAVPFDLYSLPRRPAAKTGGSR